jgi:histidyl-tRNA synthetase
VDVIGSDSLLNEYELIRIIDDIFSRLKINIVIKVNNRKILSGIAEYIGEGGKMTDITVAIDKLDKIGIDGVNSELREKGISSEAIAKLQPVIGLNGTAEEKLGILEKLFTGSELGTSGVSELRTLFSYIGGNELTGKAEFDITLARGLNYYTGAIIEVKSADVSIGSICGGGRYDNLTGVFGMEGVSGVGVSFGADRIYDVMTQLGLFQQTERSSTEVLVVNFGGQELNYSIRIVNKLRNAGIKSELYPDPVKLKKQISYAGLKNIPLIIIAGEDEIRSNEITLKTMATGEQKRISLKDLDSRIVSELTSNQ